MGYEYFRDVNWGSKISDYSAVAISYLLGQIGNSFLRKLGTGYMIDEAHPLKAGGITVWIEGDVLLLKYSVWFYGFLGTKRIPRANITSVSWKEPGDWLAGFMELDILGERPPSPHASPNVQNQNRLQYDRADRNKFAALRDWIEAGRQTEAENLPSVADEIAKLGKLRDQGLLTDEEFSSQKAKLLG